MVKQSPNDENLFPESEDQPAASPPLDKNDVENAKPSDPATGSSPADNGEVENLDPFDPARLRLKEGTAIGVKKVVTTISCDKPNRHTFVRVHSLADYRLETAIFTDQVTGEKYLVAPEVWDELAGEIQPTYLFAGITRTGNVFLWPVRVPDADGRRNAWHESALRAAELAQRAWVRMSSNVPDGRYDVFEATGDIPNPEWPEMSFREMLRLAFADRYIDQADHPILRTLRGEV